MKFGYKIERGYRKLTVWEFDKKVKVFGKNRVYTPYVNQTRSGKYFCIVDELKKYGINPPEYDALSDSHLTVVVEIENGVEKSREYFLVGTIRPYKVQKILDGI